MRTGAFLLIPLLALGDPDRDGKRGFRERIRCIDNGKFYRNPNTPKELAFRKVLYAFEWKRNYVNLPSLWIVRTSNLGLHVKYLLNL